MGQYIIYTDPNSILKLRDGVRNAGYVIDRELILNGFSSTEGVGWENIEGTLPKPIGLTLTLISGGVKLDWLDTSQGTSQIEIFARDDSDAYSVNPLYTINAGIITKNDAAVTPVDLRHYKIRAKKGTAYSMFTPEKSIAMLGTEMATGWLGWFPTGGWTLDVDKFTNNGTDSFIYSPYGFWVPDTKTYKITTTATGIGQWSNPYGGSYATYNYEAGTFTVTTWVNPDTRVVIRGFDLVGSITAVSIKEVLFP